MSSAQTLTDHGSQSPRDTEIPSWELPNSSLQTLRTQGQQSNVCSQVGLAARKRPRRGGDDVNFEDLMPALLTVDDVNKHTETLRSHREVLMEWFGKCRDSEKQSRLSTAINYICDAFTSVSSAYLRVLAVNSSLCSV